VPKTERLDKSHLTQREKGFAVGVVTIALLLLGGGGAYDAVRFSMLPTLAVVAALVLLVGTMLEIGRREEARTPK
jgi:hypothetical protein